MQAPEVVEGFDVLEHRPPGLRPGRKLVWWTCSFFRRGKKLPVGALSEQFALAARRPRDPVRLQGRRWSLRRTARRGPSGGSAPAAAAGAGGPSPGRRRQLGPEVVGHGPADDLARGQILDRGQVQPCMDGSRLARVKGDWWCLDRLLPCIRLLRAAVSMTASPDEVRGSEPNQPCVLGAPAVPLVRPIPTVRPCAITSHRPGQLQPHGRLVTPQAAAAAW